jgi:hypothetical protein
LEKKVQGFQGQAFKCLFSNDFISTFQHSFDLCHAFFAVPNSPFSMKPKSPANNIRVSSSQTEPKKCGLIVCKAFKDFLISFYLIYVFIPCNQAKILFLLDCQPLYRTVMSAKNFKVGSHGRPGKQDKYIGDGLISMIEYKK